ncbi:MAG: YncE family protein [Candidatus Babeliales bacterium]
MMIEKIKLFRLLIFLSLIQLYTVQASRVIAMIAIPEGNSPAAIAITPNGKFGYVANSNNDNVPGGSTVTVLDLATNTIVKTITHASFNEPYTVTINTAGTKAYVTNSGGTTVSIIDIATNTVTDTIVGFDGPSGFVITPDEATAYVNNYGSAAGVGSGNGTTVNVVNLNTNTISGTIMVGLAPASLAVTPDGSRVYTINYVNGNPGTGTMSIIRTSDNTVVGTIKGFFGPFGIAITPDGNFAYVTNFGSNNFSPLTGGIAPNVVSGTTVSKVNLNSNNIVATFTLGNQPAGVAITPDGKFVYTSNYNTFYLGANFTNLTPGTGTINVIDVCCDKILCPEIVVGSSPASVTITPDGTRAYIANYSSNDVSVINIVDCAWLNVCC